MSKTFVAPPKASMLIESMRDIGYSLETALADVIDNSITAGASTVHIHVDTSSKDVKIGIVDDGKGMSREQLLEAMRLGSRNPREQRGRRDLGRFGLGLKTASFSQCRRLTVVTRKGGATSVAIWDLDHVEREDAWELLTPETAKDVPFVETLEADGALVVWEHMDRAVEQQGSEVGRKHFIRRLDETRSHLELVFHRYLAGESGLKAIRILLNELPLKPFDPFQSKHLATEIGPTENVQVGEHIVTITAFTLPHHRNVSKAEWDHSAGSDGYLKSQGFYLYREKRLIVHGTWFGLARQTELTRLTRVRIDMPNDLDSAWHVDVKKASARPPLQVRERLQRLISEIGAPSQRRYKGRAERQLHSGRLPLWSRDQVDNNIVYRLNPDNPVLTAFIRSLPAELLPDFERLQKVIAAALPMDVIFADLAESPESVKAEKLADDAIEHCLLTTLAGLTAAGVSINLIPEMLRRAEPFRSNWDTTESLLESLAGTQPQ
jgi:anti-sigma regulatory factor (Ser/Thr protein kinase)